MTIEDNTAAHPMPMEPIMQDNLLINFTTEFHRVWSTNGSKAKPATFWRPTPAPTPISMAKWSQPWSARKIWQGP